MSKRFFIVFAFFFFLLESLNAQQTIFQLNYSEWSDGCLTYELNDHYDVFGGQHRNDNAYVRGELNRFWNLVRQYNAVEYRQGQHNAGDYVYFIIKEYAWAGEQYILSTYQIFQVRGGSSGGVSSGSSNIPSNYIMPNTYYLGYNYAYGMPIGFRYGWDWGSNKVGNYISANFGFSFETWQFEFDIIPFGFGININNFIKIPIGLGVNIYSLEDNNTSEEGSNNLAFLIESGIQFTIINRFFLSLTYRFRLPEFSRSGFSIGAGITF
jgi:hypothetical protein